MFQNTMKEYHTYFCYNFLIATRNLFIFLNECLQRLASHNNGQITFDSILFENLCNMIIFKKISIYD